jgi:hypothetical protein
MYYTSAILIRAPEYRHKYTTKAYRIQPVGEATLLAKPV